MMDRTSLEDQIPHGQCQLTSHRLPGLRDAVGSEVYDTWPAVVHRSTQTGPMHHHHPDRPLDSPSVASGISSSFAAYGYSNGPYARHASLSAASDLFGTTSTTTLSEGLFSSSESLASSHGNSTARPQKARTKKTLSRRTVPKRVHPDANGQNPKNRKEKKSRCEIGDFIRLMEDGLTTFVGIDDDDLTRQMAGNQKSSGLIYRKLDVLVAFAYLALQRFDRWFQEANRDGTLDTQRRDMKAALKALLHTSGDPRDVMRNTLLHGAGAPCVASGEGEPDVCVTHGRLPRALCHKTRVQAQFEANVRAYERQ